MFIVFEKAVREISLLTVICRIQLIYSVSIHFRFTVRSFVQIQPIFSQVITKLLVFRFVFTPWIVLGWLLFSLVSLFVLDQCLPTAL